MVPIFRFLFIAPPTQKVTQQRTHMSFRLMILHATRRSSTGCSTRGVFVAPWLTCNKTRLSYSNATTFSTNPTTCQKNSWAIRVLGCLPNARAASEPKAEPGSRAGYAHVVPAEIGVRDVIEQCRDIDAGRQLIAEFGAFAEQDARAQQFPVERARIDIAVMYGAAEAAIDEDAVARPEQALDQRDPPGQPEIAVAGFARGIDIGADMRPRRADDRQNIRRREQHLEVDVGSFFEMVAEKADIMRQGTELDLVHKPGLGHCGRGGHQQPRGSKSA